MFEGRICSPNRRGLKTQSARPRQAVGKGGQSTTSMQAADLDFYSLDVFHRNIGGARRVLESLRADNLETAFFQKVAKLFLCHQMVGEILRRFRMVARQPMRWRIYDDEAPGLLRTLLKLKVTKHSHSELK